MARSPHSGLHINGQIDGAGDDDDRSSHQRHHRQQFSHSTQTPRSVHVPLLQTVPRHDGVNKSHNVDGPDGTEAGDDGEDEVVFGFGAIQRWVGGDAGVARDGGPWGEGCVGDGAGAAAHASAAHVWMVCVGQRVMPARGRRQDGFGGKGIIRGRANFISALCFVLDHHDDLSRAADLLFGLLREGEGSQAREGV